MYFIVTTLSLLKLLRCFAENALVEMIRLLFSDLSSVEDTPTEEVINNDVRLFINTYLIVHLQKHLANIFTYMYM